MESVADQTVNAYGIIAVSAVISHVQNMGSYSTAQVTNLCGMPQITDHHTFGS